MPARPAWSPARLGGLDERVRIAKVERRGLIERADLLRSQRELGGGEVGVELLDASRAEDHRGDLRPGEQPGDADRRRRRSSLAGDGADGVEDLPVALEVEARHAILLAQPRAGLRRLAALE